MDEHRVQRDNRVSQGMPLQTNTRTATIKEPSCKSVATELLQVLSRYPTAPMTTKRQDSSKKISASSCLACLSPSSASLDTRSLCSPPLHTNTVCSASP